MGDVEDGIIGTAFHDRGGAGHAEGVHGLAELDLVGAGAQNSLEQLALGRTDGNIVH